MSKAILKDLKNRISSSFQPKEVAEVVGVTHQAVLLWCNEGTIPCYRVGSRWRIPQTAVENMIREAEEAEEAAQKAAKKKMSH